MSDSEASSPLELSSGVEGVHAENEPPSPPHQESNEQEAPGSADNGGGDALFPFNRIRPPFSHGNDAPVFSVRERAEGAIRFDEAWMDECRHSNMPRVKLEYAHEHMPKLVGARSLLSAYASLLTRDQIPPGVYAVLWGPGSSMLYGRVANLKANVVFVRDMMNQVIRQEPVSPARAKEDMLELCELTEELLDDIQVNFLDKLRTPAVCRRGALCSLCRAMPWIKAIDEIYWHLNWMKAWTLTESVMGTGHPFFFL